MFRSLSLLALLLTAFSARAQTPLPVTIMPEPAWGGVVVPAQVPYQPTMPEEMSPYPMTGDAAPVFLDPFGQPTLPVDEPLYPVNPNQSLRESLTPPDARNGFFQKAKFEAEYIPQFSADGLGWTDFRTEVVTALPFFTRENPIIITPIYELHFVESPDDILLPPRLHDIALDLHVFRVFDNKWIADLAVTPGLYADDHSFDSNDALRINGRALGIYAPTIDLKWVLGVTYVNGSWAKVVPVFGVVYEPNDDVSYELVFPRPRVAWRLTNSLVPGRDEYWFYILGEFANATWAIAQDNGDPDVFSYRDWRVSIGLEHKVVGGFSGRIELGYVFNRDIKVASLGGNDIDVDGSLMVRAGVSY